MNIQVIFFSQPIGDFALTIMNSMDVLRVADINRRKFNPSTLTTEGGPQREASKHRVSEIAEYCETSDATFPTPIILAVDEPNYSISGNTLTLSDKENIASVVDGQHRLLGLKRSSVADKFNLPVVFILNATEEQKALIFATINGKQTKVPASLIYDLFDVVQGRNPTKTAHEIARALNADPSSPFYLRLKMLGSKREGTNETLSQGTFVTHLLKHITNNADEDFRLSRENKPPKERPQLILNRYYFENRDEIILKIIHNIFSAVRIVFSDEWEQPETFIISKTTGYSGVMKCLPDLIENGRRRKTMTVEYYKSVFDNFKELIKTDGLDVVSKDFSPNNSGELRFKEYLTKAIQAT